MCRIPNQYTVTKVSLFHPLMPFHKGNHYNNKVVAHTS